MDAGAAHAGARSCRQPRGAAGHAALRLPGPAAAAAAATAPPPAATDDEATAYALGLSYHVEALVRAAEHGGGGGGGGAQRAAAMEVALEQAVASLSACQQQQAAHLQGVVARQKAGFHERLLDLERRFVAEAQALSEELAATVAADKQAAEAAVARHAQTLAGALQRQGGGGAAASLPPPPSAAAPPPARSAGRMPPRIPATPRAPRPAPRFRGAPRARRVARRRAADRRDRCGAGLDGAAERRLRNGGARQARQARRLFYVRPGWAGGWRLGLTGY